MNNRIPLFQLAEFVHAVTQHLLERTVGENYAALDIKKAETDLAVFED